MPSSPAPRRLMTVRLALELAGHELPAGLRAHTLDLERQLGQQLPGAPLRVTAARAQRVASIRPSILQSRRSHKGPKATSPTASGAVAGGLAQATAPPRRPLAGRREQGRLAAPRAPGSAPPSARFGRAPAGAVAPAAAVRAADPGRGDRSWSACAGYVSVGSRRPLLLAGIAAS